jgi:hypothetical protein
MILKNNLIKVEIELSDPPGVKFFPKQKIKKLSECPADKKAEIF